MTKKEMFATIIAMTEVKENPILMEMVQHEIDLLNRTKVETPKQKENKKIAQVILNHFKADNTAMACGEITEMIKGADTWSAPVNIQRVTNIVKNLKDEGTLERFMERKVPLYRLANH